MRQHSKSIPLSIVVALVNSKHFLFIVQLNYFKMKKVILLFTLAATLTSAIQAQCPAQIQDQLGNGTVYLLTIASAAQCLAIPNGTPVTINSGNYQVSDCGDLTGNGTPIQIQLTFNTGTPVILATAAPVSFTFGMTTCTYSASGFPPALPIELLDFKGTPSVSGNVLTWTTANEVNNKGFQVERLNTSGSWDNIGFVTANNKASTYQFTDNNPLPTSYYRLRQIDNDGTETYSKIVSVVQTGKGKGLAVYPNPVSSLLNVVYTEGSSFQILNLLGQQVLTGKTGQQLDVSALSQGTYIVKVGAEQAKFLKE
jgi:Secretion system C-terminal sorting domain